MKKKTILKYSLGAVILIALLIGVFAFSFAEVENPTAGSDAGETQTTSYMFMMDGDGTFSQVQAEAISLQQITQSGAYSLYGNDSNSASDKAWGKASCSCSCSSYSYCTYTISDWMIQTAIDRGHIYVQVTFSNMNCWANGNSSTSTSSAVSGAVSTSRGAGNGNAFGSAEAMPNGGRSITASASASASSSASAKAVFKASCSCSCSTHVQGNVVFTLYFERPTVTFTNQNSSCGSISNAGDHVLNYNSTTSSKATPNSGCYFKGWTGAVSNYYNPSITSTASYNISSDLEYSADFATIDGENWTTTSYTYNGSAQGPRASDISGYTVTHSYTGTLMNGTSYSSSSKPVNAGTYKYTATVSRGGYTLGSRSSSTFTIGKDTSPVYTLTNPKGISFGQPLSYTGISATQPVNSKNNNLSIAGSWNWRNGTLANGGSVVSASTLYNSGTHGLYYTFIPTDTNNYNAIERYVTVTVTRSFTVEAVYAGGTNPGGNTCTSVASATTSIVNNKAVVTLTAYPDTANNYVLLGWMRGGIYNSGTNFANNTITYTFTDSSDAQVYSKFQARFLQYSLNDEIQKSVTFPYTGGNRTVWYSFDLSESSHPYSYSSVTYDGGSSLPVSVGTHKATIVVTNTALNTTAATITCDLCISQRKVLVTESGINDAGWTKGPTYSLYTEGATAGAVQYYMYSTNGGSSWTKINITPASSIGCAVTFTPTAPAANISRIDSYLFKAIHETNGSGSPKAVGTAENVVQCRIDTYVPTIAVSFANSYNSAWINQDITFNITITYGGSGANIYYSVNQGKNWVDTGLVDRTPNGVTLSSNNPSASYTWTRSDEQDCTYWFRIISGTDVETNLYSSGTTMKDYVVRIDKSAPVIGDATIDKIPNVNGWINETATVTFLATDNNLVSNSGFKVLSVNQSDASFVLNSGAMDATYNNCTLTVPDCRTYVITATDYAGNTTTKTLQYNVDIVTPTFGYDEGSYAEGTWDGAAEFLFAISAGGSGVRVSYSTDGTIFQYCNGVDTFIKETGNESGHNQTVHINFTLTEEQIQDYYFRVECAAGFITTISFGTVKIDNHAPSLTPKNLDAYTAYEWGTGVWTHDTLTPRIVVADNLGVQRSGIKSVQVNNGTSTIDLTKDNTTGEYYFDIIMCTLHTVYVTDEAGNVTVREYRYMVDQGEPSFEYEAKIGATSEEYTFDADSWISATRYQENAYVRFKFDMEFSPSGVKVQYSVDGAKTWREFAYDAFMIYEDGKLVPLTLATGGYIFEPGNENGLVQNITVYVDIKTEQDNPFQIRMITGSNNIITPAALGQLRLDFTAPNIAGAVAYTDEKTGNTIAAYDVENKWHPNYVRATFKLFDATSQVESVEIRKYAADATVTFPDGNNAPYETVELLDDVNGNYYFIMTEYKKYVFVIVDKASNVTYTHTLTGNLHPTVLPKVDTLSQFNLDVTAKYTSNSSNYTSGDWIFDATENVRFDFIYDIAAFGPSGGTIQFSINNGNTWVDMISLGGVEQSVMDNGTMHPYMIASSSQMRTYLFRVITGAGNYDIYNEGEFAKGITVNKEIVAPNLSIVVKQGDNAYTGDWVNASLSVELTFASGVSGATIQVATSDSPDATFSDGDWSTIKQFGENASNKYTQSITNTTDCLYYYYRFLSGSGRNCIVRTDVIKIDKIEVQATAKAYLVTKDTEYTGNWTAQNVLIAINVICGPSGHTIGYQTSAIGAGVWSNLVSDGITAISGSEDNYTISFNAECDYIFQVISNSGILAKTNVITVRSDIEQPTFDIAIKSGTELTSGVCEANMNWWTTNIGMQYENCTSGRSGYTEQYSYSKDGVTWTEWSNNGVTEDAKFTLRDTGASGGTQSYYKFRLLNGAGVPSVEKDFRNVTVDAEHAPELVKIDNKTYSVAVSQFVDVVRSNDFATVNGNSGSFVRGKKVNVYIVIEDVYEYSIKSLDFETGDSYKVIEDQNNGAISFSVEIQGENISAILRLYKYIDITIDNLDQVLQNNTITPVGVTVDETDFVENFLDLGFDIRYETVAKDSESYNYETSNKDNYGSADVPQEIGEYAVRVFSKNENYILNSNYSQLTVVYFSGDGISTNTAFEIGSYTDFTYIDDYMNVESSYNYLGEYRSTGIFLQTADIQLPDDYTPICDLGNEFCGTFNGDVYDFYIGTKQISNNFGLFMYVASGATIMSVGVRFEKFIIDADSMQTMSDETAYMSKDYRIGALAAYLEEGAALLYNYAIGDIVVSKSSSNTINIGGLAGYAYLAEIMGCYSDVTCYATDCAKVNFGGIVGNCKDIVFAGNYAIGNITAVGINENNSYLGTLVGYSSGGFTTEVSSSEEAEAETIDNIFLKNNVVINRTLYESKGVGISINQMVIHGVKYAPFEYFVCSTAGTSTVVGNESDGAEDYSERTLKQLSLVRINALGLEGTGTVEYYEEGSARQSDANPLQINNAAQFKLIERFPWANFILNEDIDLSGETFEGIYNLFKETVFSGIFDGGDKDITGANITVTEQFVGLFPKVKNATIKNTNVLGIEFNVTYGGSELYVGGLVGKTLGETTLESIVAGGTINVEGNPAQTAVFVGGVVGDFCGVSEVDMASLVTVNVTASYSAIVGGVVGQASGDENTTLSTLVSLAKVTVQCANSAYVGNIIGYIYQDINGSGLYNVASNTYVNGRLNDMSIGVSESNGIEEISVETYERTVSVIDITRFLDKLYPFDSGTGTASDPFVITTYPSLLRIADYMYASFILEADITIGDMDGDGEVDDDYQYDFTSIGGESVFTGSLDGGDAAIHSIYNLTDSLFKYNGGIVKNLTLNVDYRVTNNAQLAAESPVVKLHDGKDIVFGAVAKYNRKDGNIKSVSVGGIINIDITGRHRVKVGGVVGVSEGGKIRSTISAASFKVNAYVVDVGGIVGSIEGDTSVESSNLQFNMNVVEIWADGGLVNAGLIIGALRSDSSIKVINYYTPLYVCGEQVGSQESPQYVGVNTTSTVIIVND